MRLALPLFLCSLFTFHCSMDSQLNQTFFPKHNPHLKIQPVQKITEVDFNNFPCYLAPDFEAPYRISNGSYLSREFDSVGLPSAAHQIEIRNVTRSESTDSYVILHVYNQYSSGSSWRDSQLHLYGVRNQSLYLLSTLFYDGSEIEIDMDREGTIKVQSQAYLDGDANCCPGALEYDEFTVENDSFVLKAFQTVKRRQ